jgi:hypothetical protein
MERIHSKISPILMRSDVPILTIAEGQVLLDESMNDFDSPTGFPGLDQFAQRRFLWECAQEEKGKPPAFDITPDHQDIDRMTIVAHGDPLGPPVELRIVMATGSRYMREQ